MGSVSGLGRFPGEGKIYPLQYSGLENSMDCIIQGVTKSQTGLRDFCFSLAALGKHKFGLFIEICVLANVLTFDSLKDKP